MNVEGLEVDCSARFAVLFCTDYHTMAPCYRFAYWDRFEYAQFGMGESCAMGVASGLTINLIGRVSMSGRGWCSHVLNVLDT